MATFHNEIVAQPNPEAAAQALFREWMRPFEARVFNLALNLTGNAADAESVLVETFVAAGRQFHRQPEAVRDYAWLARLAVRQSLCVTRASRGDLAGWLHDQSTPLDEREREMVPWVENPAALFSDTQWRDILRTALMTLSPMDRAVFVLRELDRFSDAEVAAILCIEYFDVRLRLNRARITLRDCLDPVCRVAPRVAAQPVAASSVRPFPPRRSVAAPPRPAARFGRRLIFA